ncbi:ABC transporter ATP-binding protein [Psychromicrobium silvestre]|uniref:ABC transporter ATP-binding protein n=1 Tax=Psychromicrobium silvestre TaxID=1645614 RepID=UPI001C536E80|nr:ABC transporter ATP-binding protein [Psychromicrobium silvestre]
MGESKLPISNQAQVRLEALRLLRQHRSALIKMVSLFVLAAIAGLAGPALLRLLIDDISAGTTIDQVMLIGILLLIFVLLQAVLQRFAVTASMVQGEKVFAQLREEFMEQVTSLPLSTVEKAGTGDLVSRTTNDVEAVSFAVRFAVPQILVGAVTLLLTVVAAVVISPITAVSLLAGLPLLIPITRWYLKRSAAGYATEREAYSVINGAISESVEGAMTVDALNLGAQRRKKMGAGLSGAFNAERYTLWLRSWLFPITEFAFWLPVAVVLVWGGWLASQGIVSAGVVAAVALYAVQMVDPVNTLIMWLDELQVGAASLARITGIKEVAPDRITTDAVPENDDIVVSGARYAYREGHDVLHGVDLTLRRGERLAVVGPSGAGKSTLGRLIAGIHPPTAGSVTVGGVPLVDRPLDQLRTEVVLVTQEHHVFVGSVTDNVRLGRADASVSEVEKALADVGALAWAQALPEGLETEVGSGAYALTPAQAQEIALARLVLADPHTLVLDEATSLIDPQAARDLERSLNAVLSGRTVVAIAHRLHTAHDADRVAVVDGGRITEIGSHDELLALEGSYAALWHSWRTE